jgi:hypothetical protein
MKTACTNLGGIRNIQAADRFFRAGFIHLDNVRSGLRAWRNSGRIGRAGGPILIVAGVLWNVHEGKIARFQAAAKEGRGDENGGVR